jgi:hypothetical protein
LSLSDLLTRVGAWFLGLSTWKQALLAIATTMFVVELALRTFARKSKAYAAWTHFFEGVGEIWSGVLLSIIYFLSVGPIGLGMRLFGHDPLDRALAGSTAWRAHEPNPLGPQAAARHQF